jgi:hypothetical protein
MEAAVENCVRHRCRVQLHLGDLRGMQQSHCSTSGALPVAYREQQSDQLNCHHRVASFGARQYDGYDSDTGDRHGQPKPQCDHSQAYADQGPHQDAMRESMQSVGLQLHAAREPDLQPAEQLL